MFILEITENNIVEWKNRDARRHLCIFLRKILTNYRVYVCFGNTMEKILIFNTTSLAKGRVLFLPSNVCSHWEAAKQNTGRILRAWNFNQRWVQFNCVWINEILNLSIDMYLTSVEPMWCTRDLIIYWYIKLYIWEI